MGLIKYLMNSDARRSLKKLNKMADQVEALEPKYQAMDDETLKAQTQILKDRLTAGESMDDILFDAFAALREAAKRVLGMRHFRVQIIGGICLHQGRIAEMRTGEGKTLVSTLPAYLNALTGKSVHIVTVNDYLAKRDAEWMGKVHKFMGLTVGVVVPGMQDDEKRDAYKCDIVYGTNNEFGFDYLRDNLKTDISKMVQRDLTYAIVDEVDSILVDEARTPLIISGQGEKSSELYVQVDKLVRTFNGGFDDDLKDAEEAALQEMKANKKNKKKKVVVDDEEEEEYVDYTKMTLEEQANYEAELAEKKAAALAAAPEGRKALAAAREWDYIINRKDKTVELTDSGARKAERFFRIDNIAEIEHADLNHHIQQALKAHKLFKKDEDYIVQEGEIIIVDEFTGRLMIGRRYSDGLHQAIEAKEGVEVRSENKTYATVTFQNYFRLYAKLSGMTGTAKTEEAEFRTIYSLDVVEIPTNRPIQRIDLPDMVYSTVDGKKRAIVEEIIQRHESGQPILVGTSSVDKSEEISRLLRKCGVKHNILNAKNHEREAEIVAQAGRLGAVTISTNMAGRGTDIKLGEGVAELGGLFVLGTERYESRRIDRQLRGRCSRQGDPGASQFFLSFEDDLMRNFGGSERMTKMMDRFGMEEGEAVENRLMNRIIEGAQKRVEQRNYMWRKHVLDYDDVMNQQRTIVYGMRNGALLCEEPREMLEEALAEATRYKCELYLNEDSSGTVRHTDLLQWINSTFPLGLGEEEVDFDNKTPEEVQEFIIGKVRELYARKVEGERPDRVDAMERNIMLQSIDRLWQQHITDMDALREGVRLRAQGQRDPLVEYKREAYDIFETLMHNIDLEICNNLFRSTTSLNAFEDFLASLPASNAQEEDSDVTDLLGNGDLLSALREHLGMIRAREAEAAEAAREPQMTTPGPAVNLDEPMPMDESLSGAMAHGIAVKEKKMVLPKKKVTFNLKRASEVEKALQPESLADEASGDGEPTVTLGSIDSGSVMDGSLAAAAGFATTAENAPGKDAKADEAK